MEIRLFCIILPRLEVSFLEEWVDWYLNIGVTNIHVFNNGERPVEHPKAHWFTDEDSTDLDRRWGLCSVNKHDHDIVWSKKPHVDYHTDLDYNYIHNKLMGLQDKYTQLHIVPWEYRKDMNFRYPRSQTKMICQMIKDYPNDWILNFDPDEYLHLHKHKHFDKFLTDYNNYSYLEFECNMLGTDRMRGSAVSTIKTENINLNLLTDDQRGGFSKWITNPRGDAFNNILKYSQGAMVHRLRQKKIFKGDIQSTSDKLTVDETVASYTHYNSVLYNRHVQS